MSTKNLKEFTYDEKLKLINIFNFRYQQALTTTVVFMGMMLSSTFWGNISDRYGRKTVIKY